MRAVPRFARLALASLVLAALAACNTLGTPQAPGRTAPEIALDPTGSYATGYLIVGYHADQDPAAIAARIGARVDTDWEPLRAAMLALPEGMTVEKARSLLSDAALRYTELRTMIYHDPVPATGLDTHAVDDPEFGFQWMHRQMNTQSAWDAGYTGAGIRIAIHDSYVDHRHPDLVDNVLYPGFDAFTRTLIEPTTPHDGGSDHGTSVAGTAAAVANDIAGRGIAPDASIVPISINNPSSGALDTAAIVNGGIFAALGPDGSSAVFGGGDTDNAPGGLGYVHVVNMSWGSNGYSQLVKDLMDFMLLHDIVLVTSAGNTPTQSLASPAWYPGLITVAATTPQDQRTTFSNRGLHLDLAAPGEAVWTTTTRACIYLTPDGSSCTGTEADYTYINGTSFSSPAVAGAAALVIQALADRDGAGDIVGTPTPAQVRRILTQTAFQPDGASYNEDLGYGIADAGAAVALAETLSTGSAPDGASLAVDVTLASDPSVYLANVGLALVPVGHDAPTKYVQTADGVLLAEGQALFVGIDPGDYVLTASGPHEATTGAGADTYSQLVSLQEGGFSYVPLALDVEAFDDPGEPNEMLGDARPLPMGSSVRGSFFNPATGADVDFYSTTVSEGSTYWLNLETASGSFDADMDVQDAGGVVLASNDDYRETAGGDPLPDPALVFTPAASGTVYIRLSSDADSRFAIYDLDVTELIGSESEPNGAATSNQGTISSPDFTGADPLGTGQAITGTIDVSGSVDIFEVAVDIGTWVVDLETAVNLSPDTVVTVFDSSGSVVANNDDYDVQDSRVEFPVLTGATYYVAVSDYAGGGQGSTGPYTLSIAGVESAD